MPFNQEVAFYICCLSQSHTPEEIHSMTLNYASSTVFFIVLFYCACYEWRLLLTRALAEHIR